MHTQVFQIVLLNSCLCFQMAKVAVPRRLLAAILKRIQRLSPVLGVAPSS
jgi:hypothetical protein